MLAPVEPEFEPAEEVVDRVCGPGAPDLVHVGGVVLVAQQRGTLGAQPGDAHEDLAGVVLGPCAVPAEATVDRRAVDALAQAAVLQAVEDRLTGRVGEGDEPAVQALGLGGATQTGLVVLAQPGQLGLVGDVHRGRGPPGDEQPVELRGEGGQLAVELAQAGLPGLVEGDAAALVGPEPLVEDELVLLVQLHLAGVRPLAQGGEARTRP